MISNGTSDHLFLDSQSPMEIIALEPLLKQSLSWRRAEGQHCEGISLSYKNISNVFSEHVDRNISYLVSLETIGKAYKTYKGLHK